MKKYEPPLTVDALKPFEDILLTDQGEDTLIQNIESLMSDHCYHILVKQHPINRLIRFFKSLWREGERLYNLMHIIQPRLVRKIRGVWFFETQEGRKHINPMKCTALISIVLAILASSTVSGFLTLTGITAWAIIALLPPQLNIPKSWLSRKMEQLSSNNRVQVSFLSRRFLPLLSNLCQEMEQSINKNQLFLENIRKDQNDLTRLKAQYSNDEHRQLKNDLRESETQVIQTIENLKGDLKNVTEICEEIDAIITDYRYSVDAHILKNRIQATKQTIFESKTSIELLSERVFPSFNRLMKRNIEHLQSKKKYHYDD